MEGAENESKPEQTLDALKVSQARERQNSQRAGPELSAGEQFAQGRQAFRARYKAYKQAKQAAIVPKPRQEPVKVKAPEKALETD